MGLKIYNSLSNKLEEFQPIHQNTVNMYVCGPTVYNYIHLGNARPVIFFDMLSRYLTFLGYKVNYVSNITDIDDRIINKAIQENTTEKEITKKYTEAFLKNVKDLGSNIPDVMPNATDYIEQMISFINELIQKGFAYESNGDVYFNVSKLDSYGKLSNQIASELNEFVRIEENNNKQNSQDFVLWKKTDKGIKWDSPFGTGRPGWHTECVVMNQDIFKGEIDIHGGGMDLKFPHHENEIAQSKALYNHDLSKYWIHVGRLDLDGVKMSKSLGNVILVNDVKEEEKLMAFRMLILSSPYRSNISYSDSLFEQHYKEYDKIKRTIKNAYIHLALNKVELTSNADKGIISSFTEYMNDDFNTPNVFMLINRLVKDINQLIKLNNDNNDLSIKLNTVQTILQIFGFVFPIIKLDNSQIELFNKWNEYKKNKEFDKADEIRTVLSNEGLI
ncbi:MAG: cysteine--tRNA ligase [Anaeroplasmataceae bacterium]